MTVTADDPRLLALADRLWPAAAGETGSSLPPIQIGLRVDSPGAAFEGRLTESWTVQRDAVELRLGSQLSVTADVTSASISGWVSADLLEHDPGLIARLLLEVPVAALLQRRAYAAIHAAAIAGPRGAVVLRGAPGSGKSTLAAAAHLAGMDVLGDESVLVARDDPDELLAAVRDPTLEPDTVRLLNLDERLWPATERIGPKQRLDLFASANANGRARRRIATVILGPRSGPARLDPLNAETFTAEFQAGGIREELWADPAPRIESTWSQRGAYRLSGAGDLRGAITLLAALVGHTPEPGSPA
ncbi:MAG: hypothetical protein EXR93_01935 [Gemmatimonadetes bacterium]|nr:hypothetical protein [Gemmatimonadota bacterium]